MAQTLSEAFQNHQSEIIAKRGDSAWQAPAIEAVRVHVWYQLA